MTPPARVFLCSCRSLFADLCFVQLHFRLSATILKLLEANESDLDHELLFSLLVEAATGPFARGEEKSVPSMPRSLEK